MAIHRVLLLSILLLLSVSIISVNARPCKTILFISSSSSYPSNQNPNLVFPNPRFITFSYTTLPRKITFSGTDPSLVRPEKLSGPVDFDSSVGDSIRDRTLDILSIVSALLFGVGCGALTAATMYLAWYICNPRSFEFGCTCDESDEEEDDEVTAAKKKLGYVAVPFDGVAVSEPAKQVE